MKLWTFIEVAATITLMLGVALTSFNIYPANLYMSMVGNILWLAMGIHWNKLSLMIIQTVVCLIYLGGFVKLFYGG